MKMLSLSNNLYGTGKVVQNNQIFYFFSDSIVNDVHHSLLTTSQLEVLK